MLMSYFMAPVRWCHRCKADMHQTIKKFLTLREQTQTHLQGHSCWVCHTQDGFRRRLRRDALAPTRTSTYTQNFWCQCVCVCACIRAVLWWAMEVSPATACGCVPLWCWQGEGGYEIGAATAVFQTTAGAVCPLCSLSPPSSFSPETLCFICPSSSPVDASLVSLKTSETLICTRERKIQGLPQNVSNQTLKHARVKVMNCYQAAAV